MVRRRAALSFVAGSIRSRPCSASAVSDPRRQLQTGTYLSACVITNHITITTTTTTVIIIIIIIIIIS